MKAKEIEAQFFKYQNVIERKNDALVWFDNFYNTKYRFIKFKTDLISKFPKISLKPNIIFSNYCDVIMNENYDILIL